MRTFWLEIEAGISQVNVKPRVGIVTARTSLLKDEETKV